MYDENYNIESAESQEVAEPEVNENEGLDESAENQEVAEPENSENPTEESEEPSGRTEADAAFAEMRRRIQELEQNNSELARRNGEMHGALSRYFEGEDDEELIINANAYAEEVDPDVYREEYERGRELEDLRAQNAELQEMLTDAEVNRLMQEGLREVQEIDPNIQSLDELGDVFVNCIASGLFDTKQAYYAALAYNNNEKVLAPDAIGKVADTKSERDYFTSEELDALTPEELDDDEIWAKAMRSMERL